MPDIERIRQDFPLLAQTIYDRPLVYLDNAATTQMPECVLDAIRDHYHTRNANVHRSVHKLSEESTAAFEESRASIKAFFGASDDDELVFTSGTTDAINKVAFGLEKRLTARDRVIVTELEHHSNWLPWLRLAQRRGCEWRVVKCPDGEPDMEELRASLDGARGVVAVTEISNLTGMVMPIKEICAAAREAGYLTLVDGAQGARSHGRREENADFYCFSGHKVMGPYGTGGLLARRDALDMLEPFTLGGGMVDIVGYDSFSAAPVPHALEGGTPNVPGAIGLAEALRYIEANGKEELAMHEKALTEFISSLLEEIEGVTVLGHPKKRQGVVSFVIDGVHPYDAASMLDKLGFEVRSGNHCAQPALRIFGCSSAVRVSPAFYNTFDEIRRFAEAVERVIRLERSWTRG